MLLASLGAVVWLAWSSLTQAESLLVYTEEHPPFSFYHSGELTGISVQAVQALISRLGEPLKIDVQPWTRSYHRGESGESIALFPMVRTPEREAQFQWVGPLMHSQMAVYTRRSDALQLTRPEDLQDLGPIPVPKRWPSHELLESAGLSNVYGVSSIEDVLRMFAYERSKVLVADGLGIDLVQWSSGFDRINVDELQWQFNLMPTANYIAFSHSVSAERVAQWQQQLEVMRGDGSLLELYRQWLPHFSEAQLAELLGAAAIKRSF